MVRVGRAEQSIVQILIHLCTHHPSESAKLAPELALTRETVSKRLAELETLSMVKKEFYDPKDRRKIKTTPTFFGLFTVYTWLANQDLEHPLIEKMAQSHGNQWIILLEYPYLKKKNIHKIINHAVCLNYPHQLLNTPEDFSKYYREYISKKERTQIIKVPGSPAPIEDQDPYIVDRNELNKKILGLTYITDFLLYNPQAIRLLEVFLENNVLREYVHIRLQGELVSKDIVTQILRNYFPEETQR
jgi:hypothetical protein